MIELITIPALLGICAFTVTCILMAPGEILSPWASFLSKLPRWIAKPLGACEKCLAGQFGLWLYPFWFIESGTYDPVLHAVFTLLSVFSAVVTTVIYVQLTRTPVIEHRKRIKIPEELISKPTP